MQVAVEGDGSWTVWRGTARLSVSGRRIVALRLEARDGRYGLAGRTSISQFLKGKGARLSEPIVEIAGSATLGDRRLDGRLSLRSPSMKVEAAGVVDLGASSFENLRVGADLLKPSSLFPNMSGNKVRVTALIEGPFGTASFAYRLTSPRVAFDNTGFEDVLAEGHSRWSKSPIIVPIRLSARRVTGVGDVAGGILANLRVEGILKVTTKFITGEGLMLTSDKLKGKLSLLVDLVTGDFNVVLSGGLTRYFIPGLGIVDVTTELKVVPAANKRDAIVTGRGHAWIRRFDNAFLASLAGGLPEIETGLLRTPDQILHFQNLRLTGPAIRITGNGYRRRDGSMHFEGSGTQREYGPLSLVLDGMIDHPKMTIRLQRPMDALGLKDVTLNLDPTPQGFAYRAEGGSTLGPFTSNGVILTPTGQATTIRIAALDVSGPRRAAISGPIPAALRGGSTSRAAGWTGHCCSARLARSSGSRPI